MVTARLADAQEVVVRVATLVAAVRGRGRPPKPLEQAPPPGPHLHLLIESTSQPCERLFPCSHAKAMRTHLTRKRQLASAPCIAH
jgi:hypothetical protein